jgi:hypothetical protein
MRHLLKKGREWRNLVQGCDDGFRTFSYRAHLAIWIGWSDIAPGGAQRSLARKEQEGTQL